MPIGVDLGNPHDAPFPPPDWSAPPARKGEYLTLVDADLRVLYINRTLPEAGDVLGQSMLQFIDPRHHAAVTHAVAQTLATGWPHHYQVEAIAPQGATGHYSNWTIRQRFAGRPDCVCIVTLDLTHQTRTEESAEQVQRTLESVAGTSADYILIVNRAHRVDFINRAPEGVTREQVVGTRVEEWLAPGEQDQVGAMLDRVFQTGEAGEYTTWAELPAGRLEFATRVNAVARDGRIERVTLIARDITAMMDARRELAASEAKLRAIMTNANAVIYLLDAEGTFLLSEGRQLGLLGLRPGEVVGQSALQMYAGFPEALHSITEALAGREYRGLTPLGDLCFEVVASPFRDIDGKILGVVGMGIDVTERERAGNELRDSEARYRLLVERSPEAIVVMDALTGKFVEANAAAERLFGRPHEQLRWLGPAEVSPPRQPDGRPSDEAARGFIGEAIAGGRPHFEWMHAGATGDEVPCEIWLSRLPDATRTLVQGNITDLRPRKAAEAEQARLTAQLQQASKLQAIGQLTGGVAHDFNNLLTVIMGNLELIAMGPDPAAPPAAAAAQTKVLTASALEAAQRGSSLTHRLLAFSRKQPLQPRRLELNRIMAGMEDLLVRTLGETIAVESVSAAGLWACEADPTQLEHAVLNLAINARDAMPAGGKLTIETGNVRLAPEYAAEHGDLQPGQYVMLAVTDTGTGIAPAARDKVFEPFFTTKGVGEGSGLGLSMVYGFLKQSGGHVRIYSEVGEGTTVKLYLPRASATATSPEPRASLKRQPRGGGELILVVEDDPRVRALSVALLERLGYRTVAAGTAAQGYALLNTHPEVQLLFTDVVLPDGMSGVELAQQALALRPGLKVLFTSGYTENAIIHHGRLDAGVELLEKPFTLEQLATRVRDVLDG